VATVTVPLHRDYGRDHDNNRLDRSTFKQKEQKQKLILTRYVWNYSYNHRF
jgi:hypothetical protein